MTSGPARRALRFHNLDEVIAEVESLRTHGYDRAGNWGLGQACSHLANWMAFPLDGFPRPPVPVRAVLWMMRKTMGRRQLAKVLAEGTMPAGGPTLRETVPLPNRNESTEIERLKQTVARFKAHSGPLHPSPLFGELDREMATRLQLVHCAHHLSFLAPRATGRSAAGASVG